jgi:Cof subfamily protein (haloacid dehalogenase superfamily)
MGWCMLYCSGMKNLPKNLFFDFDGTLVDPKTHEVPPSALKALHALKEKGYRLAIASGRNPKHLKITGIMEALNWDGFILNNGQVILDKDQNTLVHHFIEEKLIHQILAIARSHDFNVFFSCVEGDFIDYPANDLMIEAHDFFQEPIPEVGRYSQQRVDKILVYAPKDYDYAQFKALEGIEVFPSVSTYCDIASKGISKASSIKHFLNLKGYGADYAGFGDSMNDYEMLKEATLSIAMNNGEKALKAIADVVAPDVDDDGIEKVLIQLGYL